ncbi:hypothetical protein ARMSODRAFT_1005835 [Armillaria solidipes]|uniref:F-box domain-containing protein n=1 Tax=Armillaria solidipes TaxID=1076256 RepID=A0A2H3BCS6_9AGAR|nr:hypothetical protein ARMSODRAFT_1005835 [Armillaria solidipes]
MAPNLNLQLPQELADAIIDTVRETSASSAEAMKNLSSCSLVSRSFLPRTRLYMFADIPFLNAENVKRYHDICLASPIIPPAARTLAFQTFDLSAVESPLMASILRLTTNAKNISFFKVSWDKLPEEVLDVISSYQKISRILFKDTVIPSIDSFFSFFRGCTIRSSFTLIISGSLHVGNAEEQVELTPPLTYDNKPIAIQSLTLECPDAARKALRAVLLFPSSPFNLRHLVTTSLAIIGIPPADTWIDANAAFQRDVISSSNLLEKARSHFVIQAVPSFPIRLPDTIQTLNIGLIDPPRREGLALWPSSLLRWWINTLLQSRLKAVVIGIGHQGWLDDDGLTATKRRYSGSCTDTEVKLRESADEKLSNAVKQKRARSSLVHGSNTAGY